MSGTEMDILHIMMSSGIVVKLVLLLLVVASVVSWAIAYMKFKVLKEVEVNNKRFIEIYNNASGIREIRENANLLESSTYQKMFVQGHDEILKLKNRFSQFDNPEKAFDEYIKNSGMVSIERAMNKGANDSNLMMESFLSILASIGSITPFIGLFGTVWGIIHSFTGLSSGNATLESVAPGIAEALVATAVGLAAAIPAVWFFNYFSARIAKLNTQMESFGQEFLNLIERNRIRKD